LSPFLNAVLFMSRYSLQIDADNGGRDGAESSPLTPSDQVAAPRTKESDVSTLRSEQADQVHWLLGEDYQDWSSFELSYLATPKRPPAPEILDATRRDIDDVHVSAEENQKQNASLQRLLADYLGDESDRVTPSHRPLRKIPSSKPPVVEMVDSFHTDVSSFIVKSRGMPRIDYYIGLRELADQYGIERLDACLFQILHARQPFSLPVFAPHADGWMISGKASIERYLPESPPQVLLFKRVGEENVYRTVEMVYIFQNLKL